MPWALQHQPYWKSIGAMLYSKIHSLKGLDLEICLYSPNNYDDDENL